MIKFGKMMKCIDRKLVEFYSDSNYKFVVILLLHYNGNVRTDNALTHEYPDWLTKQETTSDTSLHCRLMEVRLSSCYETI